MKPYDPSLIPALNLIAMRAPAARPYLGSIHVSGHLVVASDTYVIAALDWSVFGLDLSHIDGRRISPAQWNALRVAKPKALPHYEFTASGQNGTDLRIKSTAGEFTVSHDCPSDPLSQPLLAVYPAPDPDRLDATPVLRVNPDVLDRLIQGCRQSAAKETLTATLLLPSESTGYVVIALRGLDTTGEKVAMGTGLLIGVSVNADTLDQDMAMFGRIPLAIRRPEPEPAAKHVGEVDL